LVLLVILAYWAKIYLDKQQTINGKTANEKMLLEIEARKNELSEHKRVNDATIL
jgi:hypothetical protein